jgi:class 3 adenylate cyclase/HAMP domain-containing protein
MVLAVLCASITAYWLMLPHKTHDLRFLTGAFSCWTGYFLLSVLCEAALPVFEWFVFARISTGLIGLVLFVGFTYTFRADTQSLASTIKIAGAAVVAASCILLLAIQLIARRPATWGVGSGAAVVMFAWAEAVLVWRWWTAKTPEQARSYRDFVLAFTPSVLAVGLCFLRDTGLLARETATLLCSLFHLTTLVAFVLAYLNNASVPTTFRVKIVGASLFIVLALLTVVWIVLAPPNNQIRAFGTAVSIGHSGSGRPDRQDTPSSEIAQRLAAQTQIVRFNYCIVGSALFILTFLPVFFRVSLVEPLNALLKGVEGVDSGFRDIELPITSNDEIGSLTASFNRMARSLKAAEDDVACYTNSLELKVKERTLEIARKNEENERLLQNILPVTIAERLKRGEKVIADSCCEATVLFADIVGFTDLSTRVPARELVELLNRLISDFDQLAKDHGVEKIKTIGDAYMAVAGVPYPRHDHAEAIAHFAIGMLCAVARQKTCDGTPVQLRIGINSGPVIAGVIGTHKFAYDLWGDTVNTASRMQSYGKPGCIQVTDATYSLLKHRFPFQPCGELQVKGKGHLPTYLLAAHAAVVA